MERIRTVITGIGIISPNGIGFNQFCQSIISGVSGIERIIRFNPSDYTSKIAGEVRDFNPADYMDRCLYKRLGRFAQFAVAAARLAIEDSEIDLSTDNPYRVAVIVGNSTGGQEVAEEENRLFFLKGSKMVRPSGLSKTSSSMASGAPAFEFGIKGPNVTVNTGCSSGLNAIGMACDMMRSNKIDVAIAGGTEAPVTPALFSSFCATGALSKFNEIPRKASRPFDKYRDGYILSEGAGAVIIENYKHAQQRNAKILAEIYGYGVTNDCYNINKMEPEGIEVLRAMELAAVDAEISPQEIDYINAHGSSSPVSDKRETNAIKKFLSEYAYKIKISSIKSMIGQPLAAAGVLQIAASILSINQSLISPTINYENPDPDCDLDYVPNFYQKHTVKIAMMNSFGMGGNNISMILGKFVNPAPR